MGISTSKNLTSKTVSLNSNLISNWIWGGVTADDVRGCYDPVLGDAMTLFYPVLVVFLSKLNSKLPSVFVEITSVKVPVFEITLRFRIKRASSCWLILKMQMKLFWLNETDWWTFKFFIVQKHQQICLPWMKIAQRND